ncbi:MAG: hypothetical protein WBN69_15245 [Eudoraea sp.]
MKTNVLSYLLILFTFYLHSQTAISGNIKDWNDPGADIVAGMNQPITIGSIDDKGDFIIELNEELVQSILSDIDGFNENSDEWKTSLNSIDKAFSCHSETVAISNGEQPIISLTTFGSFSIANILIKKMYGSFMMVNTKDFAEGVRAFGKYQNKEGYYLDMYYFEEAASVKGECSMDSYAVNQEEMYSAKNIYELDFQPGWNIVQYQVIELFKDKDGKTYEKTVIWKTLDKLPKDLQYVFFPR